MTDETAGVHRGARRRGGVAAGRARSRRAGAPHRRAAARSSGRCGISGPDRGVPQGLALLGWNIGRNVRIDIRWATSQCRRNSPTRGGIGRARARRHSGPGTSTVPPLLQATRTVPIVFPFVIDPVGAGYVDSLARPGGNATGFMNFEFSVSWEMVGVLKADRAKRDASGGHSGTRQPSPTAQFGAIQAVALVAQGGSEPRSTCATPARSSDPSRRSRALRMAV